MTVPACRRSWMGSQSRRTEAGECSLCLRIIQTQAGCVSGHLYADVSVRIQMLFPWASAFHFL